MDHIEFKRIRKILGHTQQIMADMLGVDRRSVINYEKEGYSIPNNIVKLVHHMKSENNVKSDRSDVSEILKNPVSMPDKRDQEIIITQKKLIESQDERIKLLERELKECKKNIFFKAGKVQRDT